jgi:hypothetical protein
MTQNKGAAANNNIAIDFTKPKLERFRGNEQDALEIKTWCMQVSRLDTVQGLENVKTATIVMEALQEQALYWALLLQDEDPDAAADWKLLKPQLIERFDKAVNETHKFKLIAALQQRQTESSKDFLDRCKTAWYGLLRSSGPSTRGTLREQRTTTRESICLPACPSVCVCYLCISASSQPTVHELVYKATLDTSGGGRIFA